MIGAPRIQAADAGTAVEGLLLGGVLVPPGRSLAAVDSLSGVEAASEEGLREAEELREVALHEAGLHTAEADLHLDDLGTEVREEHFHSLPSSVVQWHQPPCASRWTCSTLPTVPSSPGLLGLQDLQGLHHSEAEVLRPERELHLHPPDDLSFRLLSSCLEICSTLPTVRSSQAAPWRG